VDAQGGQDADAADAEDHLLAQPVLAVAAVEAVGLLGIQQVQVDPPDPGPPHLDGRGLAGEVDGDRRLRAGRQAARFRVDLLPVLVLPAEAQPLAHRHRYRRPTATIGTARSLAVFSMSPASMPRPPA
jgi:hypothetical protein